MNYLKKVIEWEKIISEDKKSGGSTTVCGVQHIPDFDKFTEKDWVQYRLEKSEKENVRLKLYLSWAATAALVVIGVWANKHPFLAEDIFNYVIAIGFTAVAGSLLIKKYSSKINPMPLPTSTSPSA